MIFLIVRNKFLLYFGTCTFFVFVLVCFEFKMHLQISWAKLHFSPSPHPLPPFLYLFAFASAPLLLHGSRVRVAVSFGRICPGRCFSPVFLPFLPACAPCWACRGCWKGEKGKKRQELALFDGVAAGLSEDPCYVARVTTPLLCLGGLCSPSDWEVGFLSKLGSQLKLENYFFQPDCAKVVVVLWRPPRRWKTKKGKVTPSVSFFWLASHTALFVLSVWGCLAPLCAGPPLCWLKSLVSEQVTWLILPVVICLSQRLSHACPSTSLIKVKPRMAH